MIMKKTACVYLTVCFVLLVFPCCGKKFDSKRLRRIEYLYNTSKDHKRVGNAVSDMLKKHLSVDLVPLNMEWKVYLKKMNQLEYDLARSGWIGDYNDPMTFLNLMATDNGNNRTGWSNSEYDRLIREAAREQDQEKRKNLFYKAEEILWDEMPVVPLYFYVSRIMFRKDQVGGIYPNVRNWIRPGSLYCKPAKADRDSLILVLDEEPKTLDPAHITGTIAIRVAAGLFEGLTVYNEKTLQPEPGLAESWTVSEDKKTYTFKLKKTYWSNGDELIPDDLVYSWKRILLSETGAEYAYMMFPVRNAEKFHNNKCAFSEVGIQTEGNRLIVELESPTPYFLDLTSFVTYYPVHKKTVETHGDQWIHPDHFLGNGAYVLKEHSMHNKIVLAKNTRYHAPGDVKLQELIMRIIPDEITGFNEYEAGKADIITTVPIPIYRKLKDQNRDDLHVNPMLGVYYIRFNVTRPPFDRKEVRRAIACAIDPDFITEKITASGEMPAYSFVPPGTAGKSSFKAEKMFDPEKAGALLRKAGYSAGKP